jgi:hypothetical protein
MVMGMVMLIGVQEGGHLHQRTRGRSTITPDKLLHTSTYTNAKTYTLTLCRYTQVNIHAFAHAHTHTHTHTHTCTHKHNAYRFTAG